MAHEEEWAQAFPIPLDDFVCEKCGSIAYTREETHPSDREWACLTCQFCTNSVAMYFKPARRMGWTYEATTLRGRLVLLKGFFTGTLHFYTNPRDTSLEYAEKP